MEKHIDFLKKRCRLCVIVWENEMCLRMEFYTEFFAIY